MDVSPASHETVPATPSGQRRQVTVLFADMVGYTALAERLGEEQTYLLMQKVHRELSEAVHAEEGTVQEVTGDGVMALFGAPVAVEDAPLRACRAGLDIQVRMAALAGEIKAEQDVDLGFRVGINSGPLVVGEVGDAQHSGVTALGDTVNLAARIESQAAAGQVLLSGATHVQVEGFVDAEFAGEHEIKGKAEKQKLWRLDAVRQGVTRFDVAVDRGLTPLIGRARELERLEALWREASAGNLRAVTVVGEAGIGKSRLVHEFRRRIDDGRTFFLDGQCTAASQATPFAPLIELVGNSFRISRDTSAADAQRKLEQGLEMLGIDPGPTVPYLLNLLGHPPRDGALDAIAGETLGVRTRDAILAMLRERCRISPTAIIVEDLHWTDTATEGLLQRIAEGPQDVPLLLLVTARSGYSPPWPDATELRLAPLSEGRTEELLRQRLGVAEVPEALARLVAEKSEGNPLFAEEIAAYLQSSGAIDTDGDDIAFSEAGAHAVLPASIENLLMDRFDRLDEGPRAVLETAAAIGHRFTGELIGAAAGLNGATAEHLEWLKAQDLVVADRGDTWRFHHGLARDAIYDSLLTPRRQELHERIAEAVEKKHGHYPEDAADLLAHHWSRTARAEKAVKYLTLAGEYALRIYSLDEAEQSFQQALDLIEANPGSADDDLLTDILLNIARVMYFQGKFFAIIDLVEPYLERVEALGDKTKLSRFLFESGYANVFASNVEDGRKLLARARALGEETGDELAVAYADLGTMWDRMFWGAPGEERLQAQREAGARIVEIARRHGDIWLASKAQLALGLDVQAWGRPAEGRAELMKLMAMSRETNDPRPRGMALWALNVLEIFAGNYAEAIERADEALRVCLCPVDRSSALGYKAMAMVMAGQVDDGMSLGTRTISEVESKGLLMVLAVGKIILATGTLLQGDMAKGIRGIEDTTAWYEGNGQTSARAIGELFLGSTYLQMAIGNEKPPLPVMLRNLPFLLRTLPVVKSKARRHLQSALDGFRAQDIPSSVARCQYELGRLDRATKKTDAARERFAEAREIAVTHDMADLISDIDAAMAELPGQ